MSLTAAKAIRAAITNKDIAELLSEDAAIFGVYKPVYDFIGDYYNKHNAVPPESVIQDSMGENIFDDLPATDGATNHYLNELRNEYLRAEINDMLIKVSRNVDEKPPGEVLDKIASKITELSKHASRTEDVDIMDIDMALDHFREVREADASGELGLKTLIPVIDEYVPTGLTPGMSVTLFGYSTKGKSWIADLLAINTYLQGKRVLFVSLEMPAHAQRARIFSIAGKGQFTMSDLQRGNVNESEMRKFSDDVLGTGGRIIVTSVDGVSEVTPNVVKSKIDKYKPHLVIFDYMQLMSDNARTKEMTPKMLKLSGEIKRLAVSAKVPIVSISAVTDDDGKKRNTPPTAAQLAWSRAIEYDSDLAIAVHRYENTDIIELACRKNRNGQLFNLQFEVDLSRGIFEPIMEGEDEEG